MAFQAGAVIGEAILKTAKWTSGVGIITKTAKSLVGIAKKVAKIGFAAVTAGMAASIVQANAYQKEFANVSTLTGQNTAALQKMSLGLLSLDSELGSTRELTKSMYDAISAGAKPGAEALQVVADSAKFAKASLADNAASVKLLSAATNAYGRENLSTTKAADIFFTTIKKGVITGEELAGTIGQSIPLFASMKIPVEQLSSGMAAMTKQGVSASESTTQLNAIVNSFLKPSAALSKELENQGFQSGEAFIKAKGLTGALDLLKNATEGGRAEIADLTPNIRAMRGVMALSGQGAIEYADTLKAMESSAVAVDTAFQKQEKTFATFKNELGKTSIIVGNIGKSFVDDIAGGAQKALESLNNFLTSGEGLKTFSEIAAKVGGAFSVIKTFGQEVFDLFKDNLFKSIEDIKKTFNELFPKTLNSADAFNFLAGAVDIVGAALNIVVAYAKLVIKYWLNIAKVGIEVVKVAGNLWDVLIGKKKLSETKEAFAAVGDAVKNMGKTLVDDAVNIVEEAKKQWKGLSDDQETNAAVFASSWEKGSKAAKNVVQKNYLAAVSGVKSGSDEIVKTSDETTKTVIDNEKKVTTDTGTEIEKRKGFYNGWADFVEENLKTTLDKFMFWSDKVLNLANTMFSGISDISSLSFQNEKDKLTLANQEKLTALDEQATAEQDALVAQLNAGLITEDQFNTKSDANAKKHALVKEKIEKDAAKKSNDLAKKQFKAQKAFQIGQTWMDAARATLGFWAWGAPLGPPGWVTAGIMTGSVLGIAAAKTALIAKQQFVPAFAKGTDSAPGGISNVGEAGIELVGAKGSNLVDLARGAEVLPNNVTEGLLSGGNRGNTEININNPVVRDDQDIPKIAQAVSRVLARELQFA